MESRILEVLKTEAEIESLKKRLEILYDDPDVQIDIEFRNKLKALMKEYGKTVGDIIRILIPTGKEHGNKGRVGARRQRKLKSYKNPHTGEVIETRGGYHRQLRSWKETYGLKEVESWLQDMEFEV